MGFLDTLLGRRKVAGPAKRDRLFAISTAYVTLDTSFEVKPRGVSALVFQPLATGDFAQIVRDMEDLVVGVNAVSTAIQGGGYGDRVLCAVFALRDNKGKAIYWIYNYKRGTFYPFVPAGGGQQRDSERELRLKAQIGAELPIEPELERWFPLWGIPV